MLQCCAQPALPAALAGGRAGKNLRGPPTMPPGGVLNGMANVGGGGDCIIADRASQTEHADASGTSW
jgi:hypothetical protein